eukprot:5250367-Amphidinium_carterae.1
MTLVLWLGIEQTRGLGMEVGVTAAHILDPGIPERPAEQESESWQRENWTIVVLLLLLQASASLHPAVDAEG